MSFWTKIKTFVKGPQSPDDYWASRTNRDLYETACGKDSIRAARAALELKHRTTKHMQFISDI